jgi:hypothetical protein
MTEPDPAAPRQGKGRWLFWLFAGLGVATALAIIWLALAVGTGFRSREPALVAAADPAEVFEVGQVDPLTGTDLIAITITGSRESAGLGSVKSGYADRRNVLLLNRTTGETRRIMPDNRTRITEIAWFPARGDEGASATGQAAAAARAAMDDRRGFPPAYYALQLRRSTDDIETLGLLVGTLATGKQGVVMEGISGIEQSWMIDSEHLGLIVRENRALFFRVIDIPALKQTESRKIEIG